MDNKKRLKYNRETNIIEVIEEKTQVTEQKRGEKEKKRKKKRRRKNVNFVISILSFVISVGALGISYSQKHIDERQMDVNIRQFDLENKPVFECHIEREDLYDNEAYWNYYNEWLYENDIKIFDEWQQQKFTEENFSYNNRNDRRTFWDAYDAHDLAVLEELTQGAFIELQREYADYLSSKNYIGYDDWKEAYYIYEKDDITLKNTGGYISNAHLEIFTYIMYHIEIGDDISYEFVMDMGNQIFSEFWTGTYWTNSAYDSENNAFHIEYIQDRQYHENEYLAITGFSDFIEEDELMDRIGLDANEVDVFIVESRPVYFSIKYLDREQEEHTEWYRFDLKNHTLNYVEACESDVEVPDLIRSELSEAYYEAYTLYVAETLGYQNAQRRPILVNEDFSYIESAKEKIIFDLKKLLNDV